MNLRPLVTRFYCGGVQGKHRTFVRCKDKLRSPKGLAAGQVPPTWPTARRLLGLIVQIQDQDPDQLLPFSSRAAAVRGGVLSESQRGSADSVDVSESRCKHQGGRIRSQQHLLLACCSPKIDLGVFNFDSYVAFFPMKELFKNITMNAAVDSLSAARKRFLH